MRLWFLFELLMFFVLLAFAASRSVGPKGKQENVVTSVPAAVTAAASAITAIPAAIVTSVTSAPVVLESTSAPAAIVESAVTGTEVVEEPDPNGPSRFCKCGKLECDCCREFKLPVLPISSSGCASLKYLKGDKMALTMRLGGVVLRNVTISGKKARPACVNLPGGFSQFCGRVYGVSRQGDAFKACLGLELRALSDLEASLRVSCFKFSPTGVTMEPAPPLPPQPPKDEDDDDFFGLGLGGGDDDEEEEDDDDDDGLFADEGEGDDEEYKDAEADEADDDDEDNYVEEDEKDEDDDDDEEGLFGGFFSTFFDDGTEGNKKKKKVVVTSTEKPVVPIIADKIDIIEETAKPMPLKVTVTTVAMNSVTDKPIKAPITTTIKPIKQASLITRKPIKVEIITTTERQPPTTIVLSPTSSVTVTTSASTTQRAEIPDPIKSSASQETAEETETTEETESVEELESAEELDSDEDATTEENATEDNETFSNEFADAIKDVVGELTSVADIVDVPEGDKDSEEESAEVGEESTGKPSAVVEVTTEDNELDFIDEVEQLAEEVNITEEDDDEEEEEKPPQIGVAMDGEPRGNATTMAPVVTKSPEIVTKSPEMVTKSPVVVTKSPVVVTKSPEIVTKSPIVVTKSPEIVTKSPVVVTKSPEIVTKSPEMVTKSPVNPVVITNSPVVITKAPEVATTVLKRNYRRISRVSRDF